ncbi:MAG: hypothetical protein NVSMB17_03100 [Candidatus Dormibacteria bacterium]
MSQTPTHRPPIVLAGFVLLVTAMLGAAAWGLNSVTNPQPVANTAPILESKVCAKAPSGHPNAHPVRNHPQPPTVKLDPATEYFGTMCTARGMIVFKLRTDTAPVSAGNFIALADSGFYDGLNFHRVCPNTADSSCGDGSLKIAQGGDPKGDGTGGPGYSIADEGPKGPYPAGTFAMARSAKVSGSQFFIDTFDNTAILGPQPQVYNLFADITEGLEVAQQLRKGDTMFWVAISRRVAASPGASGAPAASPPASPAAPPAASPSDTTAPSPAPS